MYRLKVNGIFIEFRQTLVTKQFKHMKQNYSLWIAGIFISLGFLFSISCNKSDDSGCNFTKTAKTVKLNSATVNISAVQLAVNNTFEGDEYTMVISVVGDDCNKMSILSLSTVVVTGGKLNRAFPIKSFADSGLNSTYGSLLSQSVNPVSQVSTDLASGTALFEDKGNKLYAIKIDGTVTDGTLFAFSGDVQF